jgi:glutamyl-tRNA synthetase
VTRALTDREEADPDFVIMRSDGSPVFHFVNVVDDLEMGITHVIRGEDHLSNTSKHVALFQAFGVEPPKYAHIPLILNADGSKMSKRDTGAALTYYMDNGYASEALLNYLCLLGWSPKDGREVIPLKQLITDFDLPQILRHNARFDHEKLKWMNGEYLRTTPADRFYELSVHTLARAGVDTNRFPTAYVKAALDTCVGKLRILTELPAYGGFYFTDKVELDAEAKAALPPEARERLKQLRDAYASLAEFTAANLETTLKETAKTLGVKNGVLVHPARFACTGKGSGPSLYHLLEVLGKERVLVRMDAALAA